MISYHPAGTMRRVCLDVAWLCPACGHPVPAGQTVYEHRWDVWRCLACLDRLRGQPADDPRPA